MNMANNNWLSLVVVFLFIGMAPGSMAFGQGKKDSLLLEFRKEKHDTNYVKTLLRLSSAYKAKNYDSSLYFAKRAKDLAQELNFRSGVAKSYSRMGSVWSKHGKYDSASYVYHEALRYFEEIADTMRMSQTLNKLGLMARYMEKHAISQEYFLKSLDLKKRNNAPSGALAIAYQNIGINFAIMKQFTTAMPYVEQATELFLQAGDSNNYYTGLMNLSSLYRDIGEYKKSAETLLIPYEYRKRSGDKDKLGICLYNLGLTLSMNDEYAQSIRRYNEARTIFAELGDIRRMVACDQRLANVHFLDKNYAEVKKSALRGLSRIDDIHSPYHYEQLHTVLAKVYYETKNYRKAYDHQEIADSVNRAQLSENNQLRIVEMQKKYDDEANKRQIAELSVENAKIEQKARRRDVINYALIGLLVLVLGLALILYRMYSLKQISNNALREKNKVVEHSLHEKDVLLREIHHRVQNNLQFVSSLLNLQSRRISDTKTQEVLKSCKQRIQSMALIHQKLYQEDSLSGIDIGNYTRNLIESLQASYSIDPDKIKTEVNVEKMALDINTAISIGLILSELITNSFKYAFNSQDKGLLVVSLFEEGDKLVMQVEDNGVGLPEQFDIEASESFGLKLVHSLAKKLKATVHITSGKLGGTHAELRIQSYSKVQYER